MQIIIALASLVIAAAAGPLTVRDESQFGPVVNIAVVDTGNGHENQAWAYGNSYCSQRIKLTSGQNICANNRQYSLKNIPLVDKTGVEQAKDARPDMTFSFNDCEVNNGGLNLEKVKMTTTIQGQTASWGCTAARENRECILNGETGSESAVTVYLKCGIMAQ